MPSAVLRIERLNRSVHEARFLGFAQEFRDAEEEVLDKLDVLLSAPDEYFDLADRFEHDRNLPVGLVPMSRFLFFDGNKLVGQSNLRRRLSPLLHSDGGHIGYAVRPTARRRGHASEILRQTLGEASRIGIARALLTVAATNLPSLRVVEKNGGVFDAETVSHRDGATMRRYWIETAAEPEGSEIAAWTRTG
jgi:predicted acetyltransferase